MDNVFLTIKEFFTSDSVYSDLTANIIVALLGILGTLWWRYFKIKLPNQKLWGFQNPSDIVICTSVVKTDTGEYTRPATGIGQVKALVYVITSLNKAYRKIDIKNIYHSEEHLQHKLESDLVVLGGPKNNRITKLFFERYDHSNIVLQSEDGTIYWQENNKIYRGEVKNGEVIKDFGLIIRIDNKFTDDKKTKFVLLSGHHTYGTIAAARYFCERIPNRLKGNDFIILVSCDIHDGYPINIKKENEIILNIKGA